LPEAQLNLAQAVIHLATAEKSNRSYRALGLALEDARASRGEVPSHLRDAHYRGAAALGHGAGYDYPHDHDRGWVAQQYRPAHLADRRYYEPTDHGYEAAIAERMAAHRPDESSDAADPD